MMEPDLRKKLILLDRDGVLNEDRVNYVTTPEELIVFPRAIMAVKLLKSAGFRIGICTNQAGIARGYYDEETLAKIHAKLQDTLESTLDSIEFCPFLDDNHINRKPNPGMLFNQAKFFDTDLSGVPFVGDSLGDIEAARRAGAVPILVKTGKGTQMLRDFPQELQEVTVFEDLLAAVEDWLS